MKKMQYTTPVYKEKLHNNINHALNIVYTNRLYTYVCSFYQCGGGTCICTLPTLADPHLLLGLGGHPSLKTLLGLNHSAS